MGITADNGYSAALYLNRQIQQLVYSAAEVDLLENANDMPVVTKTHQ